MRTGRIFFALGAFLFLLSAACVSLAGEKPKEAAQPTIVIVHGAWGGSWAFRRVDHLLKEKGFDVYRPSLTGLGERVHLATPDVGLSTHIDDVANAIVFEDLHDIVLVGHSYGGMVISGVADRMPERIRKLIYLDALVPEDRESVMKVVGSKAAWLEAMVKDGFLVPPWLDNQPWPYDVPQPLKTFTEPISLKNPAAKKLPATYILTVEKGKRPEEDDFADAANRAKKRGWRIVRMTAGHNPQFDDPAGLATLLAAEAK